MNDSKILEEVKKVYLNVQFKVNKDIGVYIYIYDKNNMLNNNY